MILLSLRLHNWRQFRGTTPEIHFSAPGSRPVTVLFGTNGAGKTSILNAFTWTLYDSTTRGFLFPEQIVNKSAIRDASPGETIEAWAEIRFRHLGNTYLVRKTTRVIREADEPQTTPSTETSTELQFCSEDGVWQQEPRVAEAIGRVLPLDLHTYFFFDGERIERIVRPDARERADIANATKMLIGLEVLERAMRHLKAAQRHLEKEYKSIGDAETVELISEKERIETERDSKLDRLTELERNISGHRSVKEELEERLRHLNEVKSVQERRDFLNGERDAKRQSLTNIGRELSELISARGYTVYMLELRNSYEKNH